eukprot:2917-Pleurochrysis_carterae.AAC.6
MPMTAGNLTAAPNFIQRSQSPVGIERILNAAFGTLADGEAFTQSVCWPQAGAGDSATAHAVTARALRMR